MAICKLCGDEFKKTVVIEGKVRNLQRRKYCLKCSPFGSGNTKKLEKSDNSFLFKPKTQREKESIHKKTRKWQNKARKERKEKLIELKGGKCKCGYNKCIASLEFHHRDPEEKEFNLNAGGLLKPWNRVLKEADKCDLLCANCHAELHYNINNNVAC
tara:strand:+ start:9789 stop:10259 length:471 start_codon:yes stop_codon:yes gene_type:complete